MASIAHHLPASIGLAPDSEFSASRNITNTFGPSGVVYSRGVGRYPLRKYKLTPPSHAAGSAALADWQAFADRVRAANGVAWIPEPLSMAHRDLLCSPVANGTRTTFGLGVMAPADVVVFVDGVPVDAADYTIHQQANVIPYDESARGDWLVGGDNTTRVLVQGVAAVHNDGASTKATTNGTTVGTARQGWWPVTEGRVYTVVSAVLTTTGPTDDFTCIALWGNSTPGYIGQTIGSPMVNLVPGVWTAVSATMTASVAGTANAIMGSTRRTTSGVVSWYHGATAMCPGDYATWHPPSLSPGLVEFNTAPAAGSVVTASATGRRITRCVMNPSAVWKLGAGDRLATRGLEATESPVV